MDAIVQHPWRTLLLTPLPAESVSTALADDHPQWRYIDGEMVKLGSLAHNQLDIADIQTRAITLLSQESKDCRLFSHLLQSLQCSGHPADLLLAITLLADYVDHFWTAAWPNNAVYKRRLTQQMIKRFNQYGATFAEHASPGEQAEVQRQLSRLQMRWRKNEPKLAQEIAELIINYQPPVTQLDLLDGGVAAKNATRASFSKIQTQPSKTSLPPLTSPASTQPIVSAATEAAWEDTGITHGTGLIWQNTLLNIAEQLCKQQPELPIGYRLRRNAVWNRITQSPAAQADGRTLQIAPSAERVARYLTALSTADHLLWQQLEQSLILAPYWLDGHYLSAQIALLLECNSVAEAIRDELCNLLDRLPALRELSFTDGTPFLSMTTSHWLDQPENNCGKHVDTSVATQHETIWRCYQQQGLEAALQAIEQQQQQLTDPRNHFYSQLLSAQLLEKSGFIALAQQHYLNLLLAGKQISVIEWEPSLFRTLQQKLPEYTEE